MSQTAAQNHVHSWNPPHPAGFADVRIEDDVREALQNVRVRRPSLEQRRHMLELSACAGVEVTFLGFPAASEQERSQCADLINYISEQSLPLSPVLMARVVPADLIPILDIQQRSSLAVTADIYLSTSPLRAAVEGWDISTMLGRLEATVRFAADEGLTFRIAFEDSTRSAGQDLRTCVQVAIGLGARCIVLNDTAGACYPAGAARHTSFVAGLIAEAGQPVELAWHGHNDQGLALANSLAAIEAGATLISGTFLGLGERTGNLALEQLMVILADAGHPRCDLRQLVILRDVIAESMHVDVPAHLPVVGADAFSTATGTHAAAILKARRLGPDYEDAIYSAVSAIRLGRSQEILLGPNSGRVAVSAALAGLDQPSDDAAVDALLAYCKSRNETLRTRKDIERALATP